jgi:hypothetical protein
MSGRGRVSKTPDVITSASKEYPHIGRRVRVECSDGKKYDGIIILWDPKVGEYKIVFDDGE